MASMSTLPTGKHQLRFTLHGKRRKLTLATRSRARAELGKQHVEHLVEARKANESPPADTLRWAREQAEDVRKALADFGLIEAPREATQAKLGPFLEAYVAKRTDLAESTRVAIRKASNSLVRYFGEAMPVSGVTLAKARDWHRWLSTSGKVDGTAYAEATVRLMVRCARLAFADLVDDQVLTANPFSQRALPVASVATEHQHFVSRDDVQQLIEAAPCREWRLAISLSRFGGLRFPSEVVALHLEDIHWDSDRVTIRACKTKERQIPLFPELRPYLLDVAEQAEDGQTFLFSDRMRTLLASSNGWHQLARIARQAGIALWPRAWHNMRASRQTELHETFPPKLVCDWLGNSSVVSWNHYQRDRESDWTRAAAEPTGATSGASTALQT